tara:strand:- start:60 stop:1280 length:1221 start_codon:yes stop_codon:yes gene_type:complete
VLSPAEIAKSENLNQTNEININYINPKKELQDYIIDIGDNLFINFYPAKKLSDFYAVNEEGEVFLPRLRETNVRGLTTTELENFLEQKYSEFLITPDIYVKIAVFRGINITVAGEVRYPGVYKFAPYKSSSIQNFLKEIPSFVPDDSDLRTYDSEFSKIKIPDSQNPIQFIPETQNKLLNDRTKKDKNNTFINYLEKNDEGNITTISDLIRKAGGITSSSDLERVQIIRDIPIGKGGGKKSAVINLSALLNDSNTTQDIRLFDGDYIFIPTLSNPSKAQVPRSIVSGLSPRFVKVNVLGRVSTPGEFMLPLEGTLSDAMDVTGPIKPLSGKVILIRYNRDGTVSKKKIAYSANAPRGSKRNPFIKEGDLITVTKSVFGKTTGFIGEVTAPFFGIYSVKTLIEDFQE